MAIWSEWMASDPTNPRPVALVGDLYLRGDEVDEAISYYRKSLEMQPGQLMLMSRLARILDVQAEQPEASRDLLNRFSRLFPQSPVVALAQAEWLIRRRRYEEAIGMIQRVIEADPENLNAMSLLHPLLRTPEERYINMLNMLRVGRLPGREASLAFAIRDNDLLTKPESWVMMDFLENMAAKAPTPEQRRLFSELLPRKVISSEDFRIGRMSTNWISSREETWSDDGRFLLAAEPDQTEAFLRLVRSDAMHNAFVEAEIEDSRGFFWIYARRGRGNMVRFGFEDSGQLYLQIWMNNHLVTNETRMWSRSPGPARLRLSIRGDGAMGYINGIPAFGSPVTIPDEMGLGWWGIAPWSAKPGEAQVSVVKISGGPLPVRLVMLPQSIMRGSEQNRTTGERSSVMNWLDGVAEGISTLAPEWFTQEKDGDLIRKAGSGHLELRLLARYYRMRLLPMVRVHSPWDLDLNAMAKQALEEKVDGFTLVVDRLPDPQWLASIEPLVIESGLTLHVVQMDPVAGKVSLRELCGTVGVFAGPRRVQMLPLQKVSTDWEPGFENTDGSIVLWLNGENTP
jgi:tetratricopeptide (TPR) repeat protein